MKIFLIMFVVFSSISAFAGITSHTKRTPAATGTCADSAQRIAVLAFEIGEGYGYSPLLNNYKTVEADGYYEYGFTAGMGSLSSVPAKGMPVYKVVMDQQGDSCVLISINAVSKKK